jgi:streptomycin 6-kinase
VISFPLPEQLVADLLAQWWLRLEQPLRAGGTSSWVAPVVRAGTDEPLLLKVARLHPEAEHEPHGLRLWDGDGAVRLHETTRAGDTYAVLLERCEPGTELGDTVAEPDQDPVVAGLLQRLWREPGPDHPFRPLAEMCEQWAAEYEEEPCADLDQGLEREGLELYRELARPAPRDRVLVTDLHAGNILAAGREPWLVIDPKPYVGDPAYDPTNHLLNCRVRLFADPEALVDRVADLCGVEAERLRLWLFARLVVESSWWPELAEVVPRLAPR